jgi:uncharacterized membrane protein YfcA
VDPGLLRDVLTLVLGFFTGVLSGAFGVGGAVISSPGIRLLGASALVTIGTTLPAIIPGAAAGAYRYHRERLIHWRAVAWTAPAGIVAAVGGAWLAPHVPGEGHLLQLVVAGLLAWSAYRLATPNRDDDPVEGEAPLEPPTDAASALDGDQPDPRAGRWWAFAATGALAGGLSGLLGIGGGVVMVPAFAALAGLKLKQAIGTSLVCVGIFAVPGTITHALQGGIDWRFALLLTVAIVPGARAGAALTMRANDRTLRRRVAWFLAAIAVLYAAGEAAALLT